MAEIPRKRSEASRPVSGGLDLGFGELLGEKTATGNLEVSNSTTTPEKLSIPPQDQDALLSLALRSEWGELERRCDEILRGKPNDIEASLWWIRTQLKKGGVPLFVLASPLDGVLKRIVTEEVAPGIKELAKGVTQEFVDITKANGDQDTLKAFQAHISGLGLKAEATIKDSHDIKDSFVSSESEVWNKKKTENSHNQAKSGSSSVRVAILFGVFAFAVYFLFSSFLGSSSEDFLVVDSTPTLDGSKKALIPPAVERDKVGELDALYYGLGEKTKSVATANEAKSPSTTEVVNIPSESPPVRPLEREKVDTSGPKEPSSRPSENREDRRDTRKDPDIGYEVQKYRTPRRFEVVADTLVLSKPSHEARPVSKLRRGDEIVAHERIGYWLKIYSDKGSPGFVLEQDVISSTRR